MTEELRMGALCWNQYTDWPACSKPAMRADELGFYSSGHGTTSTRSSARRTGPMFEGYMTLAAWAQATKRVRVGLMVGANPFRNPALVAKMATTLDHISGGRAYLGIGSAWNETEARRLALIWRDHPVSGCAGCARRCR